MTAQALSFTGAQLLTVGDVSVLLGVKRLAVQRMVKSGRLPAIITKGGHRRILRADADAMLEDLG